MKLIQKDNMMTQMIPIVGQRKEAMKTTNCKNYLRDIPVIEDLSKLLKTTMIDMTPITNPTKNLIKKKKAVRK